MEAKMRIFPTVIALAGAVVVAAPSAAFADPPRHLPHDEPYAQDGYGGYVPNNGGYSGYGDPRGYSDYRDPRGYSGYAGYGYAAPATSYDGGSYYGGGYSPQYGHGYDSYRHAQHDRRDRAHRPRHYARQHGY